LRLDPRASTVPWPAVAEAVEQRLEQAVRQA
jgi:hypothetical protein